MSRRNWAAFYRSRAARARRALAEGQHRPDHADRTRAEDPQQPTEQHDDQEQQ